MHGTFIFKISDVVPYIHDGISPHFRWEVQLSEAPKSSPQKALYSHQIVERDGLRDMGAIALFCHPVPSGLMARGVVTNVWAAWSDQMERYQMSPQIRGRSGTTAAVVSAGV